MSTLDFRSVLETGAEAQGLVLGLENHNRGLCLRLHERQSAGQGKWARGVIEILYEGEGTHAALLQQFVGRPMDVGAFLEAFQKRSHDPVVDLKTLVSLQELRNVLVRLLAARPFVPFGLRLTKNDFVTVSSPYVALVADQTLILGQPDRRLPAPAVSGFSLISLIHVRELDYCADRPTVVTADQNQELSVKGKNQQ